MAHLTIVNMRGTRVNVSPGQTVLQALHAAGIDWMHACGAKGRCTTCKMQVEEGMQNITPLSPAEEKYRAMKRLAQIERLTCQCSLTGPVQISVPSSTQLPHQTYSTL